MLRNIYRINDILVLKAHLFFIFSLLFFVFPPNYLVRAAWLKAPALKRGVQHLELGVFPMAVCAKAELNIISEFEGWSALPLQAGALV